ncbi:MAG: hypothetical protein ACJAVM_002297 [Sulfitobacter sp.]|jgi:uncharacterized protein
MTNRRHFLAGMLASGLTPRLSWADAGAPRYLSAAARPDGQYVLCGIGRGGEILFDLPLPARGHAAAAHPQRPEAVAFARRPGRFALVICCARGMETARLEAPEGRHFFGHGAFSSDGRWLFTSENDYEAGQGVIGMWDAQKNYRRVGEFASGGIGPHDIRRLPDSDTLVVANGGIDTHPESGRSKLNIPTMQPNLSYIEGGALVETVQLPAEMHKNSIRHLAISARGEVAFGMQWQGDGSPAALVGLHLRGQDPRLLGGGPDTLHEMQGYIGSIVFDPTDSRIAVTSSRGGMVQIYDAKSGALLRHLPRRDCSGVCAASGGFIVSSGAGTMDMLRGDHLEQVSHADLAWDNHLVAV